MPLATLLGTYRVNIQAPHRSGKVGIHVFCCSAVPLTLMSPADADGFGDAFAIAVGEEAWSHNKGVRAKSKPMLDGDARAN